MAILMFKATDSTGLNNKERKSSRRSENFGIVPYSWKAFFK
jgi:hypothetical protein